MESWKLGPVLRSRERTRLIQGLGRCTRGDTDYSLVFWLRQSLVDAALSPSLMDALPPDVRAELMWGRTQSEGATDQNGFVELLLDLLNDVDCRAEASQLVRDDAATMDPAHLPGSEQLAAVVADELKYSKALWEGYFEGAIQAGQAVVDHVTDPVLAGYRGWWWFLTAIATFQGGDGAAAREALMRALACGANRGFISDVIRGLPSGEIMARDDPDEDDFEAIWSFLTEVGWAGPAFDTKATEMLDDIGKDEATPFHMGVEILGRMLGAHAVRRTEPGVPDVVWCFPSGATATFEAKTDKGPGSELAKRDILEANGHVDWAVHNLHVDPTGVVPAVIAYTERVHDAGEAHIRDLRHVHPERIRDLAALAARVLSEVRPLYREREYAEAHTAFGADLRVRGLAPSELRAQLLAARLLA